jgi:hypothetical protein
MTRPSLPTIWALLALLTVAGCTTMGTGYGSTASGTSPVHFSWSSSDGVSGTMSATLADGSVYAGSYFQITDTTTSDTLGPLWDGWGPDAYYGAGFGDWGYWGAGPEFVTHYTGRVVANLANPQGKHIRCKFHLAHPSSGMAGGGLGDCQLPEGKTIEASFAGAS